MEDKELQQLIEAKLWQQENQRQQEEIASRIGRKKIVWPWWLGTAAAAAILAAGYLFKEKPLTIFDFGTTLTVDFVDAEGHYLGGNISPGCRTRFKALNRYSKVLPLVDTPEDPPVTGASLREGMEAGVITGIMFEIEGYISRNPGNIVIFTGGDAIYFAKRMKNSIFVVCNLVLMGLALITENNVVKTA